MKNRLCIVLVFLVFSTTLNHGQKIKSNERRAVGIFPYPRTGRHLAMASFARVDGNAGMVNYPRVGRSGPISSGDQHFPHEFSADNKFDNYRDFEPEITEDLDYIGHNAVDYEEFKKRLEALKNGGVWPGSQSSSGQAKEQHRLHRCNQQIDGPWAVLFASRGICSIPTVI